VIPDCVGPGTVTDVDVEDVDDVDGVEPEEILTQYASSTQRFVQSLPIAGFQA